MIRKNAMSLILTAVLALTILVSLPIANATSNDSMVSSNYSSIPADEVPVPTPTPGGGTTDSGVSGGGNGG